MRDGEEGRTGYVGWDVGAWLCGHTPAMGTKDSRDALVILMDDGKRVVRAGDPWRGNLAHVVHRESPGHVLDELLDHLGTGAQEWSELVFAIDTPLGWPDAFTSLLGGEPVLPVGEHMIGNPLLFRATERQLARRAKLFNSPKEKNSRKHPLSAVNDMIGSQATKGMAMLRALRLVPSKGEIGIWKGRINGTGITAIETYPAPLRCSQLVRTRYRSLKRGIGTDNQDVHDALMCALIARLFHVDRASLVGPDQTSAPDKPTVDEGWIWVPGDCLVKDQ